MEQMFGEVALGETQEETQDETQRYKRADKQTSVKKCTWQTA